MSHPQYRESYYRVQPQPPRKRPDAIKPTKEKSLVSSNNWAMMIHLGQFAHGVAPLGGIVAPILVWQLKKDEHPEIDEHGKNVVNWIVSQFLYSIVAGILAFFIVGIPLLLALVIVSMIFPIIGAIKASNGIVWRYPGTIRFFK